MANEIKLSFVVAQTDLYAIVFNAAGQVYDLVTAAFETFDDSQIERYDVPLVEAGDRSGFYLGTFPVIASGVYQVVAYQGDKADTNNDTPVGSKTMHWDGTDEIDVSSGINVGFWLGTAVTLRDGIPVVVARNNNEQYWED